MADDVTQSLSLDVSQYVDAARKVITVNDQWATATLNVTQAIKANSAVGSQVEASMKGIANAAKLATQSNKEFANSSFAVVKSVQQFNESGELTKSTITRTAGEGKQLVQVFEDMGNGLEITSQAIKNTGDIFPIASKQAQAFGVELLKISQNSGRALAKPIELPKINAAFPDSGNAARQLINNLRLEVQKAFQNTPILNKEDIGKITAGLNSLDFSKLTGNTASIGAALSKLYSIIGTEGPRADAFIQQLGQHLLQLNIQTIGKSGVLSSDPTNALRNLIGSGKIAAGSDQEVLAANKALSQLLTQVNLLKEDGKSDNTIANLFAQLGQGSSSVKELSGEFPGLTAAFVRFKNAMRDVGSEQGLSVLAQKQLAVAQEFRKSLIEQFDISQFANIKDIDANRLKGSINKATQTIATSPESLGLKDIDKILKSAADGTASALTGIRAKVFKDLTAIGNDYKTLVEGAELQTDKLIQKEEQLQNAKNLASQFRSSLPIIPGGSTSQDATLTKTINDVANFATNAKINLEQLNQVRLDILAHNFEALLDKPNKLVDLLFRAQVALERFNASAVKANTTATPDTLTKRANEISSLAQNIGIQLPDTGAFALQAREQISRIAKASLDPKKLIDSEGLHAAVIEAFKAPTGQITGFEEFRNTWVRLIQIVTQFQESERAAFDSMQKDIAKTAATAEKELGAELASIQKQAKETSASLASVTQNLAAGATARNLEAKFPIQAQPTTFNAVNRVTGEAITSTKDIEGSEAAILRVQKAIEAVRVAEENAVIGARELAAAQAKIDSGDKTGFSDIEATGFNKALGLLRNLEVAHEAYRETVKRAQADFVTGEGKVLAALEKEQAALRATEQEVERKKQVAAQDAQIGGVFSNVRNLAESSTTGFGAIPGSASVQNLEKINTAFGNVTKLITSGVVTLQQFEATLDRIRNKSASGIIAPPTEANAALKELEKNTLDIASAFQSAQERGGRLNGALTSLNNIGKIFIAQQLHTAVSRLTIEFFNSVKAASDLSIEIGRIRAITQDAAAPSDAWAQSLRKVSDASGKSVTDIATAGYGALQNQITSTKDETEDFLRVATDFARTVGSEPKDAVGLLSGAINAYGLSIKDAEKLSAEFFSVIDLGNIEAKDLGNTYGRVAVLGRQLGVTHTELGAALATVSHSGLTAEDSMTRLNNLFAKFLHPTKEGKEFFAQFGAKTGTEFVKMSGGFVEAMKVIEGAVKNGNLTLEEFTNELRGMQGQIALSGKAGETFRNFFDQISNSAGRFKGALELTKEPFGQEFTEQITKIKNLLTVDLATTFAKVFVNITKIFGDWADIIRLVGTLLAQVVAAAGGIALLSKTTDLLIAGFKGVAATLVAVKAEIAGTKVALSTLSIGAFAGVAAAGFIAVDQFINYFKQKSKEAVEQAGRDAQAANAKAAAINAPSSNAPVAAFEASSKSFERDFGIAIGNVRIMLGNFIAGANKDLEAIGDQLKTVFGQVNTTIEKGIDKLKTSIHDAQVFNQNLPRSLIDQQNQFLKDQFDIAKAVAAQKDSTAGIQGVGANTFDINAQRIVQLQKEAAVLKEQTFDRIGKTLNFSELTRSLDDAKAKLREVLAIENEMLRASEVAKVSVPVKTSNTLSTDQGGTTTQQSEGSLISTVNREASLNRIAAIQRQLINLEVEFGKAVEANAQKQAKVAAEAELKFARIKELQKEINEFDPLKKFGGQAPPPIKSPTGDIISSEKQVQDAVDQLLKKQEEHSRLLREIGATPLEIAGLFPTYQAQLRALDSLMTQFNDKQKSKLEASLNLGNFDQKVKNINEELKRMSEAFDEIIKKIATLNGTFNASSEEAAKVAKAISEATSGGAIGGQNIKVLGIVPTPITLMTDEAKNANVALQKANEAFNKLQGDFSNVENLNNAKATIESLVASIKKLNPAVPSDANVLKLPVDNINGQVVTLETAVNKLQSLLSVAAAAKSRITDLENEKSITATRKSVLEESLLKLPGIITTANADLQGFLTTSKTNAELLNETFDATVRKLNDIIALIKQANVEAPKIAVPAASPPGATGVTTPGSDTFAPSEGGGSVSVGYAKGGLVEGIVPNQTLSFIKSQSRNGDVVPALLRPREFVVTQEGTKKFLNELTMMNNGEDPFKKQVNRFFVNNYPTIGYDSPEINKEVNTNVTNITHNQNTNNEENNYRQQTQPIQVPTNSNIDTRTLKQLLKAIEYQTVMNQFPRTIKQNAAPMPVVISPDSDKPVQIINSFDDMSKTFSKIVGEKLREGLTIENFNLAVKTLDFIHGTKPRYYASGGFIDWEPRGTDKIPAMLTKGEYVMDAHHTRMFYPQLMSMSRGVRPEYFSSGGLVGGGSVSNSNFGDINVSVSGNNESVGRRIGQEILREIRRGNVKLR